MTALAASALYVAAMLALSSGGPSGAGASGAARAALGSAAAAADWQLTQRPPDSWSAAPGEADPLRPVMEAASAVGSPWGLGAVLMAAAAADPEAALDGARALVGAGALTAAHKAVLGRSRPWLQEGPAHLTGPAWADDARQSLPSGHAALSAAVFGALGRAFPRASPLLEAAGVLVALSRVYLGHHWPTDVLAGTSLGRWWAAATARGGA